MTQSCAACGAEVRDQRICGRCQAVTKVDLGNMPELARELLTVMVKQTNYQAKSDGGRSTDPALAWAGVGDQYLTDHIIDGKPVPGLDKYLELNPIATPYGKAAAASLREVRATLVSWTRLLAEEMGIPLPRSSIGALSAHLRRHVHLLGNHEAAGDFVVEVSKLVKRIMVVIDSPTFRSKIPVGPCIEQVDELPCTGTVIAYTYADQDVVGTMACQRCKKEWPPREWLRVGPQILAKREAA
jgi:hypothetical protein